MKIEIEIPDFEEIYCSYDGYDELTGKPVIKIKKRLIFYEYMVEWNIKF